MELLVVISVIGIIAALSISQVSNLIKNGDMVKAQRNAQTIANIASAAQAAGNDTIELASDLDAALQIVADGTGGDGSFTDMEFSFSDLGPDEVTKAKVYLDFVDGVIQYESGN